MFNPIHIHNANKLRKQWAISDALRDSNFSIPDSVKVIKDIIYGPYGYWNLLDLNIPKNNKGIEPLPVIVNFHGGGFFYGTKEVYQFYSADLATKGFAVVNFNYRLSPVNKFPAHLKDCNRVMLWILENAQKYHLDTNRIFFTGDSAGGSLVYFLSTILTNPEYAKLYPFEAAAVKPKAVAMNCAVYDVANDPNDSISKWYKPRGHKYDENFNIQKYVTKDFPPSYLMSSTKDFLLPQLEPQAKFFETKGIPYSSKVYGKPDDNNATHVFHINLALEIARECNADEIDFFCRHF